MSYDVGTQNYTANMAGFFRDFGAYPPDWNGRPATSVVADITEALTEIVQRHRGELAATYDAPNGWGDVGGAVEFLWDVRDDLRADLDQTVGVWW